jgi:hypothetical protein
MRYVGCQCKQLTGPEINRTGRCVEADVAAQDVKGYSSIRLVVFPSAPGSHRDQHDPKLGVLDEHLGFAARFFGRRFGLKPGDLLV